jgi:dipeptidyl aminopeptidase/acylaminoacyl peptidase
MKVKKVSWKSDGLNIKGEVYIPAGPTGPFPGLIVCHGIPAKVKEPDDRGYPLLAERFGQEGFAVLIFNFRGAGLSEGNFDLLGWTRDLEGALDYFIHHPGVDPTRIFLMGFSGGGAVSIYVAAQRKEVAALVSCASPAEFRDLITGKSLVDFLSHSRDVGIIRDANFPLSLKDWKDGFRTVKPLKWIGRIPPRPLLIIHGTEDDVVNINHAIKLYDKVRGEADLFLIEGAGHRLRVEERAMQKAMEWLRKIAFSNQQKNFINGFAYR